MKTRVEHNKIDPKRGIAISTNRDEVIERIKFLQRKGVMHGALEEQTPTLLNNFLSSEGFSPFEAQGAQMVYYVIFSATKQELFPEPSLFEKFMVTLSLAAIVFAAAFFLLELGLLASVLIPLALVFGYLMYEAFPDSPSEKSTTAIKNVTSEQTSSREPTKSILKKQPSDNPKKKSVSFGNLEETKAERLAREKEAKVLAANSIANQHKNTEISSVLPTPAKPPTTLFFNNSETQRVKEEKSLKAGNIDEFEPRKSYAEVIYYPKEGKKEGEFELISKEGEKERYKDNILGLMDLARKCKIAEYVKPLRITLMQMNKERLARKQETDSSSKASIEPPSK